MEAIDIARSNRSSIIRSGAFGDEMTDVGDLLDLVMSGPAWHADAACREPHPGVTFFPGPGQSWEQARRICDRCLVRTECLVWALEQGPTLVGVWGGTSERKRREMRAGRAA